MNSSAHVAFGVLYFSIVSVIMGSHVTPVFLLLGGFFSLLPDVDVALRVPHRTYTHKWWFAIPVSVLIGYFSLPLSFAFMSHYVADYVYDPFLKKIHFFERVSGCERGKKTSGGDEREKAETTGSSVPVDGDEYVGAGLLGFSLLYSVYVLQTLYVWLAVSSAFTLVMITLVALYSVKSSK